MMKKTRKLLPLLLIAISVFMLTACHGAGKLTAFETPEDFDTSREYEITFWAKNDTNLTQVAIYNKAIADFQELYPNIKVTMRLYTDYSRLYNDVITNISTQTTPNVCITYPDHIATYITGDNIVVSLDNLFNDEKYGLGGSELKFDGPTQDEIIQKFLEECKLGSFYYAIPYMRSTEACYVNVTYLEKLGYTLPETLTWDFIWEVCEKATEKDENGLFKINGQNVMIPCIYKSTDNMMIQYLKQGNYDYSTQSGEIKLFNDDTRDFLLEIAENTKKGSFSTFTISSYPANFLNAGQCIFAIDSTAGSTWMGSDAPLIDIAPENLVPFETVVMKIPQVDPENPQMISQGPSICVFNKEDSQEVLASWLFAQFLLTNNVQISYAETEGYVPVTSKAQESSEYKEYLSLEGTDGNEHYDIKIKATRLLLDNIDNTFVTPVFNGSASLRNAAGQLVEEVTKATRRKQEVSESTIPELYSKVEALYHLDQIEGNKDSKAEFGPLPSTSVALLSVLGIVWILIILYYTCGHFKGKKQTK